MASYDNHVHGEDGFAQRIKSLDQKVSHFVQDETAKSGNLRFRNRSNDTEDSAAALSHCNISTSSSLSTPFGKKSLNNSYIDSPESGVDVGDHSFYTPPRPPKTIYEMDEETKSFVESPLDFIQKRFRSSTRRSRALFNSEAPSVFKPVQILPLLIVIVILASSVFTVLLLKTSISRSFSNDGEMVPMNGKYKSMEYAINKRAADGKIMSEIRDEKGEVLAGKKASIQFAYDKNVDDQVSDTTVEEEAEAESVPEPSRSNRVRIEVEDDHEPIRDEVFERILNEYKNKLSSPENAEKFAKRKKRLLEKLSESGYFSTTAVRQGADEGVEKDLVKKTLNGEKEVKSETDSNNAKTKQEQESKPKETMRVKTYEQKKQKRSPPVSKRPSPFRKYVADEMSDDSAIAPRDEDYPFRII